MRRVLVYTPDLMFYSQVKGTSEAAGWAAQRMPGGGLEDAPAEGDVVVVDACRDLANAWRVMDALQLWRTGPILVCYQHVHDEVATEGLRRGATECVRRGAFLARLSQHLGKSSGDAAPFAGLPPSKD